MRKAADADPKLAKKGQWWTYDGQQVRGEIPHPRRRPEPPPDRGPLHRDQIEKAGIKVDRLEYDRAKCIALWSKTDPGTTSGTSTPTPGAAARPTRSGRPSIAQMYAPW